MNEWLFKLIGSPAIKLGEEGVELGFERGMPAWAWALVALAAAALGWLAYRRTEGRQSWRMLLGALRAALILLLAVLIAGPRLIRPNETEEKDWVLVLVDRSASMAIADAGLETGTRMSRQQQLDRVLDAAKPTFDALAAERVLVWLGFDATAYDLALDKQTGEPALGTPVGRRTDIGRAIDGALRRSASRPISGVVLISDGRSVEDVPRAVMRRLEQEKIPIFPIALGSSSAVADLSVRRANAPRYAFVSDVVPVDVEMSRAGTELSPDARTVVELVDTATGAVLDSREVRWDAIAPPRSTDPEQQTGDSAEQSQRVTLTNRPSAAGAQKWTVRVRPPSGQGSDFVDDNNTAELGIELVDRQLRVAYFDGYPRWEYRYLKELLRREQSATAAIMLLAPGKRYIQEGTVILDTLPKSPEEWANYDVIILGDVWPGVFTSEQIGQMRDRVSIGGAGLVWIGGEGSTPGAWRSTLLSELLPFVVPENVTGSGSGLPTMDGPVTIKPTPIAERLGVMRLMDAPVDGSWYPKALSDPAAGWSQVYWMQRIDPAILKPTAEVLAMANGEGEGNTTPAVLSMRYGAGRVLYVSTDEIWRWRYGRGELYPERFWIQLIRLLGRESIVRSGRAAMLEATPERATMEQPVRVQVTLIDQALVDATPPTIRVSVTKEAGLGGAVQGAAEPTVDIQLTPELAPTDAPSVAMRKITPRVFSGTWIPSEPGRYRVTATDPVLASSAAATDDLTARVEVWQADDEMRRPQANHGLLSSIAEQTGGKVLSAEDIGDLPRLLPNRALKLQGDPDVHPLWDTPLALLLIVLLATAEWIGRRLMRLA